MQSIGEPLWAQQVHTLWVQPHIEGLRRASGLTPVAFQTLIPSMPPGKKEVLVGR